LWYIVGIIHYVLYVYDGNNTLESWCSWTVMFGSQSFIMNHFNTIVSAFSCNLWLVGMGPCGWPVGASPKLSCIMLIAVSLVKLWLSVTECDGFFTVWNEAFASEKYLYFIESKLQCTCALWSNFVLVILVFRKFFQASWHLHWKWIALFMSLMFLVLSSFPIVHKHQNLGVPW